MHRTILLFVGLAGSLVACSGAPAVSSQPLAGAWRTAPEDLPYHGKIPRQDTVAINLNLSEDGRGRWQPFYSGEGHVHPQLSGSEGHMISAISRCPCSLGWM